MTKTLNGKELLDAETSFMVWNAVDRRRWDWPELEHCEDCECQCLLDESEFDYSLQDQLKEAFLAGYEARMQKETKICHDSSREASSEEYSR